MFTLWGKIRLNGAEAKREASRLGKTLGRELGSQFRSTLRRFVGIGALLGLGGKFFGDAEEIQRGAARMGISTTAYQRLRQASEELGISPEELAFQIPKLGTDFQDYIAGMQKRRPIMDPEAINALMKLSEGASAQFAKFRLPPGISGQPSETADQLRLANEELRRLREQQHRDAEELQNTLTR